MGCNCNKAQKGYKNVCGANTPPVLQIESPECPVLFHTVNIPASAGDPTTMPPTVGLYKNVRLTYEATGDSYLYDSDGIPQLLTIPGPAGGVNSVNGKTGDVTLTAEDIDAAANTIFYANVSESGNNRHIYKNPDMTGEVSAQDILDANEEGPVILRMSTSVTPEYFNDAYLQNTYVGNADYQFLFLDNRVYYEYDATTTADTTYYYSASNVQLQMAAGTGINIADHHTISVTSALNGGTTAPTNSTVGTVGALYSYVTSGTGHLAICTAVSGSTYTWSTLI